MTQFPNSTTRKKRGRRSIPKPSDNMAARSEHIGLFVPTGSPDRNGFTRLDDDVEYFAGSLRAE